MRTASTIATVLATTAAAVLFGSVGSADAGRSPAHSTTVRHARPHPAPAPTGPTTKGPDHSGPSPS